MLRTLMQRKQIIGIVLLLCFGLITQGCSMSGDGGFRDRIKKVRKAKTKERMKKMGITKYLEGVDDNSRIVFVAMTNGCTQLYTIQPNGENQQRITDGPGYKCRPVWNLPHTQVAYFQYPTDEPLGELVSVMVTKADGSETRVVVKDKKIKARTLRISWKPDSSVVYFQELDFPSILYGYEVSTGKQVETIRLPKNSFMTEVHSISPDMEYMAGAGPTKNDNVLHIGNIRRDGKNETDLMKPFQATSFHIGTVIWNYDGDLLAFEVDQIIIIMSKKFSMDFEVYTISPQDFGAALSGPAFSPTSTYMACIKEKASEGNVGSGDQAVSSDVYVMNIDGKKQRQITNTGSCFDPHW